jgi:hypothetical protein
MMLNLGDGSKQAVEKMKEQNINLWPEQDKQPPMPKDISLLESDELSALFTRLTAWSNFVAGQLAASQVDEKVLEKRRDMLEAKLLIMKDTSKVKGERVTMMKAQVMADPDFIDVEERYMNSYAYRKMLEVVYNNFERDVALVSREITRRTNDVRTGRKDKFNT